MGCTHLLLQRVCRFKDLLLGLSKLLAQLVNFTLHCLHGTWALAPPPKPL